MDKYTEIDWELANRFFNDPLWLEQSSPREVKLVAHSFRWLNEQRAKDETTEINRLRQWVNDLQSGMYINCVYCGHCYGPKENTPPSMADILKEHIEQCPSHPMSTLKKRVAELEQRAKEVCEWKWSEHEKWWVTECGFTYWQKSYDGPHCHFCGRRITEGND